MLNLGTVKPGSTIRIPFSSYDKDDGSSITMTNFAVGDILVYKDGGTTERASTAGFTATTDFDAKTGKHLAIIDLADNTTAGFFAAGSEYLVAIDSVTVDTVTTGGWIARFEIGYPSACLNTTIATLSTQTSFTLTAGPAEDDALNGMWAVIHDVASAVQFSKVLISDYTGSTKTVTLAAGATFTAAATDNFSVIDMAPLQPTTLGRTLVVDANGLADANTVKIGPSGSGTAQTANDVGADVNDILVDTAEIGAAGAGLTVLATAAQINSLAVNTRANLHVPVEIETPEASTLVYKIRLHLFDVEGNMEAPDSTPTIALTNASGTDRSGRLSVASNPSTGVYTWDYTATAGDTEEQLVWVFTVVEGGLTRTYPATSYVVEESAYRFSSTDRATLNAAATAAELAKVPKSDSNVTWNATALASMQQEATDALNAYDPPTNAEMEARTIVAANYATAANQTTIIADTNELQTDWTNGGRLDLILDIIAADTTTDIPTLIAALNNLSSAQAQTAAAAALTAYTAATAANVAAVEADTQDIQTRLPAALTAGGFMKSDTLAIDGSTTAATNQKNAALVIYSGTITGAATTTTLIDSGLSQADTDHWNGRVVIFLTGTLKYQATAISAFTPGSDKLTFTALTQAPTAGDTYIVV